MKPNPDKKTWFPQMSIITVIVSAVVAFIALKVADLLVGIRVSEDEEREGLDVTSHSEKAYYIN